MGRAPCCSKEGLNRGPWTPKEDSLLVNYIQTHGEGHWRSLPKKAGLLRCGKSCRLRWMNYLRPDIKRGNISPDEEDLIIRLHSLLGNRWSLIAKRLPGRTDNEIKNYWNTHLCKKLKSPEKNVIARNQLPNQCDQVPKRPKTTTATTKTKGHTRFKQAILYIPKPVRVSSSSATTRNESSDTTESAHLSQESLSEAQTGTDFISTNKLYDKKDSYQSDKRLIEGSSGFMKDAMEEYLQLVQAEDFNQLDSYDSLLM